MQITSQCRIKVLFKRTTYAYTFRFIQNFKPKQVRFQDFFYNLDHTLYSHTCCDWVFYIRSFNNEHITLFYFTFFLPQATPKLPEILDSAIVYTVNLDNIPASYDIKYITELLMLDEQYPQLVKQQQSNQQHTK